MKLYDFIKAMQEIAPESLADDFDNPGLLIDCDKKDIKRVLVALDCTQAVAKEAITGNYDLVLTHHPLIFNPIKSVTRANPITDVAYSLIRNGIGLYAAHTNFDKADGGVNDVLCQLFQLHDCIKVEPEMYGRVGDLKSAMSLVDFTKMVDKTLCTRSKCAVAGFRNDPENVLVKRVAVLGGAGGGDIYYMKEYGADVYITGEIKHNLAIEAQHIGLSVLEAGHYETEKPAMQSLISCLQNYNFDVEYKLSQVENSSLRLVY